MTDFTSLRGRHPELIPPNLHFECGTGWEKILDRYFLEIAALIPGDVRFQLKSVYEKYGSLRIEATAAGNVTSALRLALEKAEVLAELRSYRYCETCGNPGNLRDKGSLEVACEDHSNGAPSLPPDEGIVTLAGIAYRYSEDVDDLIAVDPCNDA